MDTHNTVEEEFRKQYDALGLKAPKGSMPGLERELIIDFWRKVVAEAEARGREEGIKEVVGELSRIESNAYPQEPEWGEVRAVANEALAALTTEGK